MNRIDSTSNNPCLACRTNLMPTSCVDQQNRISCRASQIGNTQLFAPPQAGSNRQSIAYLLELLPGINDGHLTESKKKMDILQKKMKNRQWPGITESAQQSPSLFSFLFILYSWERGMGPCAVPPPRHWFHNTILLSRFTEDPVKCVTAVKIEDQIGGQQNIQKPF